MFVKRCLLVLCLMLLLMQSAFAGKVLRLATTTSTYNSGLLDYLLPHFEAGSGVTVHVISVGTGAALRLGQDGDVDLVMTHAPEAEAAFVAAGHGIDPRVLMYNDFVLVGPVTDPAELQMAEDVLDAFSRIAASGSVFVSRGDDSGTYIKELAFWEIAGQALPFKGYRSVGQGMSRVLSLADEMEGYALTDRGTWLAMKNRLDLALVYQGDDSLFNPYQVILVNPVHHPHVEVDMAIMLSDWLVSEQGRRLIDSFKIEGEQLFFASTDQ